MKDVSPPLIPLLLLASTRSPANPDAVEHISRQAITQLSAILPLLTGEADIMEEINITPPFCRMLKGFAANLQTGAVDKPPPAEVSIEALQNGDCPFVLADAMAMGWPCSTLISMALRP